MTAPLPPQEFKAPVERRKYNRKCGRCDKPLKKWQVYVKQVRFVQVGMNGKVVRSRNKEWLCEDCMKQDQDYQREAFQASPGFQGGRET